MTNVKNKRFVQMKKTGFLTASTSPSQSHSMLTSPAMSMVVFLPSPCQCHCSFVLSSLSAWSWIDWHDVDVAINPRLLKKNNLFEESSYPLKRGYDCWWWCLAMEKWYLQNEGESAKVQGANQFSILSKRGRGRAQLHVIGGEGGDSYKS